MTDLKITVTAICAVEFILHRGAKSIEMTMVLFGVYHATNIHIRVYNFDFGHLTGSM